jgi:hypothetical protein
MKQSHASHKSHGARIPQPSNPDRLGSLEIEIVELREANDRLRQRLEEVELRAEFRVTAHRLLAIPLSP